MSLFSASALTYAAYQDVALFTLGFIGGASICAGWATVRPGVSVGRVEAALHEWERLEPGSVAAR